MRKGENDSLGLSALQTHGQTRTSSDSILTDQLSPLKWIRVELAVVFKCKGWDGSVWDWSV